jgi:hypothetical protein
MEREQYDALIITTANDFCHVSRNYCKLTELMPARRLIFIGSDEVGRLSKELNLGDRLVLSAVFKDAVQVRYVRINIILYGMETLFRAKSFLCSVKTADCRILI